MRTSGDKQLSSVLESPTIDDPIVNSSTTVSPIGDIYKGVARCERQNRRLLDGRVPAEEGANNLEISVQKHEQKTEARFTEVASDMERMIFAAMEKFSQNNSQKPTAESVAAPRYVPPNQRQVQHSPSPSLKQNSGVGISVVAGPISGYCEKLLPNVELPIFKGNSVYYWLAKIERYFRIQGSDNREKLDLLTVSLAEDALKWYNHEYNREPFTEWEQFVDAILLRFGDTQGRGHVQSSTCSRQRSTIDEFQHKNKLTLLSKEVADNSNTRTVATLSSTEACALERSCVDTLLFTSTRDFLRPRIDELELRCAKHEITIEHNLNIAFKLIDEETLFWGVYFSPYRCNITPNLKNQVTPLLWEHCLQFPTELVNTVYNLHFGSDVLVEAKNSLGAKWTSVFPLSYSQQVFRPLSLEDKFWSSEWNKRFLKTWCFKFKIFLVRFKGVGWYMKDSWLFSQIIFKKLCAFGNAREKDILKKKLDVDATKENVFQNLAKNTAHEKKTSRTWVKFSERAVQELQRKNADGLLSSGFEDLFHDIFQLLPPKIQGVAFPALMVPKTWKYRFKEKQLPGDQSLFATILKFEPEFHVRGLLMSFQRHEELTTSMGTEIPTWIVHIWFQIQVHKACQRRYPKDWMFKFKC